MEGHERCLANAECIEAKQDWGEAVIQVARQNAAVYEVQRACRDPSPNDGKELEGDGGSQQNA